MLGLLVALSVAPITTALISDDSSPYRWNLVPKPLLKRLCNLDESLPVCAWKFVWHSSYAINARLTKVRRIQDEDETRRSYFVFRGSLMRHSLSRKPVFSKWQICRDHPELNLCRWQNGGLVTALMPATTTAMTENSAEAPPTSASIFVKEPDMMLSSKWSNAEILQETVQKELKAEPNRFEGQLHPQTESEEDTEPMNEKFDETIMSANEDVFTA